MAPLISGRGTIGIDVSVEKINRIVKPPGRALHPPPKKGSRIAKMLSAILFSFDSFSEYPRNFDRGYSEKLSKSNNGLYSFPQINVEKTVLFTKISHSDGNYYNSRAPPRKSEPGINHIQIFGGTMLNCHKKPSIFKKSFLNLKLPFRLSL